MSDPCLPVHHIRPPRGWLNDPNGLVHHDGRWHVFFQYRADEPRHGEISWGHVSSDDLFTWREEPVALRGRPGGLDAVGCWSGCCTLDDGIPALCYTAVATTPRDAVAVVARGDSSLTTWTSGTVASAQRAGAPTAETRDPFVVTIDGHRYVVQGHGGPDTPAQVLLYDATDLEHWELLGPLLTIDDPVAAEVAPATIWECPNLVQVDGAWVLIVSLWQLVDGHGSLGGVRWMTGELDSSGDHPRFRPERGGVLDDGPAFYAPQVLVDGGRVLLWGWSWELERSEQWLDDHGWAGVLTAPRELHVTDGRLVATLVDEVRGRAAGDLGSSWSVAEHPCVLVTTDAPARLVCEDADGPEEVEVPGAGQVLVDASIVEVFTGGATFTTRVYPSAGSRWRLEGPGRVQPLG